MYEALPNPDLASYLRRPYENHYKIPLDVLTKELKTDIYKGLRSRRAKRLLQINGENILHPLRGPENCRSLRSLFGPFTVTLMTGAVMCFSAYGVQASMAANWSNLDYAYFGCMLILLALINGFAYSCQTNIEGRTLESFHGLWPKNAYVIRDGQRIVVPISQIVRGDLVEIKAGRRLPADVRLVAACNMRVDISAITCDEEPQYRTSVPTSSNPIRSKNMCFFGTRCLEGYGRGIVLATGSETVLGRMARIVAILDQRIRPPLDSEIGRFENLLFIWIFLFTSLVVLFLLSQESWSVDYVLVLWVNNVAANIPEGLIPTMGVILVFSAKNLARKNCVVRNLMAVDTLGMTSAVCMGKTYVLTEGKYKAYHLWMDGTFGCIEDGCKNADGEDCVHRADANVNRSYYEFPSWNLFARCAMFCHSATDKEKKTDKSPDFSSGNELDIAIMNFVEKQFHNHIAVRDSNSKVFEVPYHSENGFSFTIFRIEPDLMMFIKGEPDLIFERCSVAIMNGREFPIDDELRRHFSEAVDSMTRCGESVIGFCDYKLENHERIPNKIRLPKNLRFLGVMSFFEQTKDGNAEIVNKLRQAGIRVVMTTGSHQSTARVVAEKSGIIPEDCNIVTINNRAMIFEVPKPCAAIVNGKLFHEMDMKDIDRILTLYDEVVIARSTPKQKFMVVNSLLKQDHIVAGIGCHFRDSLAVKAASIGIATGSYVSDAITESSDIILLKEDFGAVIEGIRTGRQVFYNIEKVLVFSLSCHLPEIMPFFLNMWFNLPMPLLSKAFLCLSVGVDYLPGISLGFDKEDKDIMLMKPRGPKNRRLLSWNLIFKTYLRNGVFQAAAAYLANLIVLAEEGFMPGFLFGIRPIWNKRGINDLQDSYNQEWTYTHRKDLENAGQTAFFITLVVMQLINVYNCRTFQTSVFKKDCRNWFLHFSVIFSFGMTLLLVYCPGLQTFLKLFPLRYYVWLIGIPFALILILLDEVERYFVRHAEPGSWVEAVTIYNK